MEADSTTATLESPSAEADEAPPAASEESASSSSDAAESNVMNALLRGQFGDSTSNRDAAEDGAESDEARDGEPAPTGDAKPSDAAQGQGRRSRAASAAQAEIERLKAENERLQKAYDEANPPPPDASEEARKAHLDREMRYRRLRDKPASDTDWTPEDVDFLEKEQQRRAIVPELTEHYETVRASDWQTMQQWAEKELSNRWDAVKADLSSTLALPGVTPEIKAQLIAAPLSEQIHIHRQLEREAASGEIKQLREQVADLRRDLYGAVRAPVGGGRSSPGGTYDESTVMNRLIRGGR